MERLRNILVVSATCIAGALGSTSAADVNQLAEAYVKLVLALGQHDADYVDAFYGPKEWRQAAEQEKKPLAAIGEEAQSLAAAVEKLPDASGELEQLRHRYLRKQLGALHDPQSRLQGERLKFDEEARAIYDAAPPHHSEAHFQRILDELERKLPGEGSLAERYNKWRNEFIIPKEKLDAVFQLAIKACRERTLQHLKLPADESFTVEYVTGKSWGGYNWYQGNYRSLIQVNTDLPVYIDRAVDLAAHEGYPGHHVYNLLLEKNLVRDRGWVEFTVYPLFSPQSLIAEGTANFGKEMAFPKPERMKFERDVLFPAAGLDSKRVDEYYTVQAMTQALTYAANEAARRLLNGEIDAAGAAAWLEKYALMEPKRAQQRVRFIEQYRSYVINYNLGEDMVRSYVERRGGTAEQPQKRWQIFEELLSTPRLPGDLQ
jgi:ElaB/YqjD/DUF883 family membrane-anchored ribosome-binding protein/quinol monooxygenase YgiN